MKNIVLICAAGMSTSLLVKRMEKAAATGYECKIAAYPAAICDMNREKAEKIAEKYGIPKVYCDYHDLAKDGEIDAVAIVTPDFAHADVACAMAYVKKHILIEKPLATTKEDIASICEAVEKSGVRCMVDLHNRWSPPFNLAKQKIASGKFGKPYTAYIRLNDIKWVATDMFSWATKSSILWFLGSHSLDSLRWLLDSEAKRVYSVKRLEHKCKEAGIGLIADISPETLQKLSCTSIDEVRDWGITSVRLDYGYSAKETADISKRFTVFLNASTVTEREILEWKKEGAELSGFVECHNFSPNHILAFPERRLEK